MYNKLIQESIVPSNIYKSIASSQLCNSYATTKMIQGGRYSDSFYLLSMWLIASFANFALANIARQITYQEPKVKNL